MLNVPNSVKTLYKTDGVRKNFRVHFPNGELPDITNDDVVRESLHFTESLCSQDVFKFGLAEASVLEFETVGISNMYGMTIEASIEIDGSSLSAADKATIAGGTWDGTWDAVEEVFAIPLGVFRVESCPRDHQAMTHRKVTAYSNSGNGENFMNSFENWLTSTWRTIETMGYRSYEVLLDAHLADAANLATNYTAHQLAPSFSSGESRSVNESITVGGQTLNITASATAANNLYKYSYSIPVSLKAAIFALQYNDFDNSSVLSWISSSLQTLGIADSYGSVIDLLGFMIYPFLAPPTWGTGFESGSPAYLFKKYTNPLMCFPTNLNETLRFYANKEITISLSYGGTTLSDTLTMSAGSPFGLYYFIKNDTTNDHPVLFNHSGTKTITNGYSRTYYSFVDSFSLFSVYCAWLELHGQFASQGRTGDIKITTLDPTSPISISPGDYSEMWWDEYDVSPIGTVTVTYNEGDGTQGSGEIVLGSGSSRYDTAGNAFINICNSMTLYEMTTLLSGDFLTNSANIGFTPVELSVQGLPWVEAGDALQITAEDMTVVNTFALRIEMSGIQNLFMKITSQGGQIIGEV